MGFAIGALLPVSPIASTLGFVPLPVPYFAFLAAAIFTYLVLVHLAKSVLVRRRSPGAAL